jgi:hypothetical protein
MSDIISGLFGLVGSLVGLVFVIIALLLGVAVLGVLIVSALPVFLVGGVILAFFFILAF